MAETSTQTREATISNGLREAVGRLALALADTRQFQAFDDASSALRNDYEAQQAINELQEEQQRLQAVLALGALSDEEWTGLQRLQQACYDHPSIAAYMDAQQDLSAVANLAATHLSEVLGLDYAAACGAACGCGSSAPAPTVEVAPDDKALSALVDAAQALAVTLLAAEPVAAYHAARTEMDEDAKAQDLMRRYADLSIRIRLSQASGDMSRADLDELRAIQRDLGQTPTFAVLASSQQTAFAFLRTSNHEIAASLGFDWISLAQSKTC